MTMWCLEVWGGGNLVSYVIIDIFFGFKASQTYSIALPQHSVFENGQVAGLKFIDVIDHLKFEFGTVAAFVSKSQHLQRN